MAELEAGTIVDHRYKVLSRLGAGGMADVFLAEDEQLGRKVALKLLHRRFAEDPGFVERFRREAQAAAGLQHPNVVSVYDRGSFDDTYYIAMEYLAGRTLKQVIREEAPLAPVRAIDITLQILKAARFAHQHGVIHRDLKPHNVIVGDGDDVKVTDFGIARAGASDMTETGSIMGTAQYLSPEQAQGHAVSASSDLYSIGVVLYEMLTGHVPFDADSAVTIALKHVSEAPTAPTMLNPSLPPELEQVVMWVLNKNPADRPADADEFIAALEHARDGIVSGRGAQQTANMAAVGAGAVGGEELPAGALAAAGLAGAGVLAGEELADDGAGGSEEGLPPEDQRRRRRRRRALIALLAAALIGGGLAAYFLTRPTQRLVPAVTGEMLNIARTQLQNAGFSVTVINVTNVKPAGTVIGEDPQGGTKADQGSTVSLTVSQGPGSTTVPSVKGLPLAVAKQDIIRANLKVGRVSSVPSNSIPSGNVVDTDPAAGQTPNVGTAVTIFVSSGKQLVTVPDVTGQSEAAARATLTGDGFNVASTSQNSSSVPAGNVISQTPSAGTQAPLGSTVGIAVSKGPATVTVPNVVGDNAAQANSALTSAGFSVNQQSKDVSDQSQDGLVQSQDPGAGSSAPKGSTVTIVVGHFKNPKPKTSTTTSSSTT